MIELPAKLKKEQLDLLQAKNFGFLATVNKDGSPQVTPVWIDTDGKYVLVNTAIGRVKEKNIRRDPRVAIAVAEQKNPYNWIMVRGKVAELLEGPEAESHIDKLAKKYTGRDKFTKNGPTERRVILKTLPERIVSW